MHEDQQTNMPNIIAYESMRKLNCTYMRVSILTGSFEGVCPGTMDVSMRKFQSVLHQLMHQRHLDPLPASVSTPMLISFRLRFHQSHLQTALYS